MAFNPQTFRTRTITSIIFVIVMLVGLLWNQWSFFILFTIIHFGCWNEYQKLIGLIDKDYQQITPFHKYGVMIAGWCVMLYFTDDSYNIFGLHLHELGWWMGLLFIFVLPITELLFTRNIQLKNIGFSALGLVYISLSLGLMIALRKEFFTAEIDFQPQVLPRWHKIVVPSAIIFSLWINDTMAYLIGSWIGKTTLTKISPKKTVEGTLGGVVLTIIIAGVIAWKFDFDIKTIILIAAISAIAGTFGDLFESKLKRIANVKDSGSIMPGHGGFLDRFDSLLFAIPFVWIYVQLFIR